MVYLDCIVVEATNVNEEQQSVNNNSNSASVWSYFWTTSTVPEPQKVYFVITNGEQSFSSKISIETNPIWNSSLTFDVERNYVFKIGIYVQGGYWGDTKLSETQYNIKNLAEGEVKDFWLDLSPKGKIHLILNKVKKAKNGMLNYLGIPLKCIPFRVEYGDVILFNNPEYVRLPIKLATGSEWDHLGMVVKRKVKVKRSKNLSKSLNSTQHSNLSSSSTSASTGNPLSASTSSKPKKKLKTQYKYLLLEATPAGVKVFALDPRLEYYLETAKLGIRRLQTTRTKQNLSSLCSFVEKVTGLPYTPIMDIINIYWASEQVEVEELGSHHKKENETQHKEKTKVVIKPSYFCSQLLIEAYRMMELETGEVHAEQFFPVDFSETGRNGMFKIKFTNAKLMETVVFTPKGIPKPTNPNTSTPAPALASVSTSATNDTSSNSIVDNTPKVVESITNEVEEKNNTTTNTPYPNTTTDITTNITTPAKDEENSNNKEQEVKATEEVVQEVLSEILAEEQLEEMTMTV